MIHESNLKKKKWHTEIKKKKTQRWMVKCQQKESNITHSTEEILNNQVDRGTSYMDESQNTS